MGRTGQVAVMREWIHTITVDGSRDTRAGETGVGMVVQERGSGNGRGPILAEIGEFHFAFWPCALGYWCERLAILRALEIAAECGYKRMVIRSDYNWLRKHLREALRTEALADLNEFDQEIIRCAMAFEWMDFRFVPRRENQIAHRLANQARLGGRSVGTSIAVPGGAPTFSVAAWCGCKRSDSQSQRRRSNLPGGNDDD